MAASSSSLVSIEASFFENLKGLILAVVSSAFIGSSFIVKKLGLKRAGASGTQASSGGYGYLKEPLWWIGMITSASQGLLTTIKLLRSLFIVPVKPWIHSLDLNRRSYSYHQQPSKRKLAFKVI